jgi:glycosyltransferase involved in cell wall biosynthesis
MPQQPVRISYFCPAHNEEDNLKTLVENVYPVLNELCDEFEFIIVNNGSTDSTGSRAEELANKFKAIRVIHHESNEGYGGALKTGFENCKLDYIVYTDSDNQYDFREFEKLWSLIETHDIVCGLRATRQDSFYRSVQSSVFNTICRWLLPLEIDDINCSFKLFKRAVFDEIQIESKSALIDAEILSKAKHLGFTATQIPITHLARTVGVACGHKPGIVFETIGELIRMRSTLKKTRPLIRGDRKSSKTA